MDRLSQKEHSVHNALQKYNDFLNKEYIWAKKLCFSTKKQASNHYNST